MPRSIITSADIERRRMVLAVAECCFNEASGVLAVNSRSVPNRPLAQYAVDSAIHGVNAATLRFDSIVRRAKAQESRGRSLFCPEGLDRVGN